MSPSPDRQDAREVRVLGIGMGPAHLTGEVRDALAGCVRVVALDKGGAHGEDPLLAVRRGIAAEAGVPFVAVPDPARDRSPSDAARYRRQVADWHAARADALAAHLDAEGPTGLLVWGDPSLYDSTLRLLDLVAQRLPLQVTVLPGISAPQLLAARHGVVLHGVGEPVVVTTARRLPAAVAAGLPNVVVMLTGDPDYAGAEDWHCWWGANLGAPGEQLLRGRVGDLLAPMRTARARARSVDGWVMDLALLRPPSTVRPDGVSA